MIFSSYAFLLLFLPLTWIGFRVLRPRAGLRASQIWLLLCSLGFYALWNPIHLPLLLGSVAVNYLIGRRLGPDAPRRRAILTAGLVFNLGLLAYYKYANFFVVNVASLTGRDWSIDRIILPLAISFFTFQQIAYLVGAFRGTIERTGPLRYALFVCFFPQLIAGPIVFFENVSPQLAELKPTSLKTAQGLTLLAIGLFKKAVIADQCVQFITPVFARAASGGLLSMSDAWVGSLAYVAQLYFDFSGYSDMAIGLAYLFGITLPINFDAPYRSCTIAEFWARWHITLCDFMKYYLYIPLGGSRCSFPRVALNVMITMTLCGLWHGAGWTFVIWGALHGGLLVVYQGWKRLVGITLPRWLGWCLTFSVAVLPMVLFRAENLRAASAIYKALVGIGTGGKVRVASPYAWFLIGGAALIVAFAPSGVRWVRSELPRWNWSPRPVYAVVTAGLMIASFLNMGTIAEFLYFNF